MLFFKHKEKHPESGGDDAVSGAEIKPAWARTQLDSLYAQWPKIDGVPEEPVFLKHCSAVDMDDELLINMLTAYGIPAVKQYPANGGFGKVVLGMSGEGTDIFVPASMLNDALSITGGKYDE